MLRRRFIGALIAAVVLAGPALADSVQDRIIAQLAQQGFTHVTVSRTLLGRVRILATSLTHRREIIFNPRTGEILRDYLQATGGTAVIPDVSNPDPSTGGGSGGDDGGENDDDDDDDGDDDEHGDEDDHGDDDGDDGGDHGDDEGDDD